MKNRSCGTTLNMGARMLACGLALGCLMASHFARADDQQVHMLVPGFTVRELPVKLSNLNNLRFAPDGRLTALGYDGRVHLLRDSDGDGLEDTNVVWWEKDTISVPVGMCWSAEGLYVSSHGKVSLLRDNDGDGKAETEEVLAQGWPGTDVGTGGVDATAITRDADGNLYFGLLTPDYSNAYRVHDGVSKYSTNGLRGTILKLKRVADKNPALPAGEDFKNVKLAPGYQLEVIATGIRVPYTLAFNHAADLFLTDQEGETWCPNGNPLDELNQIIPGRNYGFPPRDDKWLPNLVSEAPVVAFGPQHQSTCGLGFNEPEKANQWNPARKIFGPSWWEGNALVAGESRGKIWRVNLVKTEHGYVGKEFLIARLPMLTTDVAISPKGDLYVSCHSGQPDWGTGPKGEGKIFKISYTDPTAPQPVATWAASPTEVRVTFDKAVDASITNGLAGTDIEFGEFVSAADRFEAIKPSYRIVKIQAATPRGKLKIFAARLDDENKILILTTAPHPRAVNYALTIPHVKAKKAKGDGVVVDVCYDLAGVESSRMKESFVKTMPVKSWSKDSSLRASNEVSKSWAPHLGVSLSSSYFGKFASQVMRTGEKSHRSDWSVIEFKLNLPSDAASLRFSSPDKFEFSSPSMTEAMILTNAIEWSSDILSKLKEDDHITVAGKNLSRLLISYTVRNDATPRVLPFNAFLPTWAPRPLPQVPTPTSNPELAGGDWQRGRELFYGDKLKCSTCHRIRGEGKTVAPDLSNLVSRDVASVLRDIKDPNATIHPDYVSFNALLKNGDELTGFVRAQQEEALTILGIDGKETTVKRSELRQLRASSVSLMPTGLIDQLKEEQVRDLLTFLLNEPPKRSEKAVKELLAKIAANSGKATNVASVSKLNVVLVANKQDHGPGQHDYPAWQQKWNGLFNRTPNIVATNAWEWPSAEQFQQGDVIIFYFWNHPWSAERLQQMDDYLAQGGGIVLLHAAVISEEPNRLAESIGLAAQSGKTKYLHTPFDLKISTMNEITRDLPETIHLIDEPYWQVFGDPAKVQVLATTVEDGKPQPMVWTLQKGKGRVFATVLGHYKWTLDDPFFRTLILRGTSWAAGEEKARPLTASFADLLREE